MEKKKYGLFQEIFFTFFYNPTRKACLETVTVADLLSDDEKQKSNLMFSDGEIAKYIQRYLSFNKHDSVLINYWSL